MMQKVLVPKNPTPRVIIKTGCKSTSVADKGTSLHAADAANVGPPSVWLPI